VLVDAIGGKQENIPFFDLDRPIVDLDLGADS
jgi:hypothetical protein